MLFAGWKFRGTYKQKKDKDKDKDSSKGGGIGIGGADDGIGESDLVPLAIVDAGEIDGGREYWLGNTKPRANLALLFTIFIIGEESRVGLRACTTQRRWCYALS